jgi:hypothetical protein
LRVIGVDEGLDSFISHKPMLPNLERIREIGLPAHLVEQRERKLLLEELVAKFNEGRSMTRFCLAAALLPPDSIREAIQEIGKLVLDGLVASTDKKALAKTVKRALDDRGSEMGILLRLRRKRSAP